MKNHILFIISIFFLKIDCFAVLNGQLDSELNQSILRLEFEILSTNNGQGWLFPSTCGSAVLGIKPLTLLTASHCLDKVYSEPLSKWPNLKVYDGSNKLLRVSIKDIISNTRSDYSRNINKDTAIIIFHESTPSLKPIPILKSFKKADHDIKICGYSISKNMPSEYENQLNCTVKKAVTTGFSLKNLLNFNLKHQDPDFLLLTEGSLNSVINFTNITIDNSFAISRLNKSHQFDFNEPMITKKDSGAPWLIRINDSQWAIIAVTNLVEILNSNFSKNKFLKDEIFEYSEVERSYVGFATRLDNEFFLTQASEAQLQEADLTFY